MFAIIDALRLAREPAVAALLLFSACAPTRAPLALSPNPSSSRATSNRDVTALGWLEGRWSGTDEATEMEEHWTSAAGGALIGMHKDVEQGRMASFEFLRIETSGSGVTYFASPRSSLATPFQLVESAERRAVFANEAHDFPQRIVYWLDDAGALHARIEGNLRGVSKSKEWIWHKR